jgi:hypothetical protein
VWVWAVYHFFAFTADSQVPAELVLVNPSIEPADINVAKIRRIFLCVKPFGPMIKKLLFMFFQIDTKHTKFSVPKYRACFLIN